MREGEGMGGGGDCPCASMTVYPWLFNPQCMPRKQSKYTFLCKKHRLAGVVLSSCSHWTITTEWPLEVWYRLWVAWLLSALSFQVKLGSACTLPQAIQRECAPLLRALLLQHDLALHPSLQEVQARQW